MAAGIQVGSRTFEPRSGSRAARFVERTVPVALDLACRARYRVEARDFQRFTHSPSTVVVANHRNDADVVVLGGVLLERRGLRARGLLPWFVAREDLFRRGFLADYVEDWPRLARRALSRLDVSFVLRAGHALPLRRVPERTLEEVLEDVLEVFGDLPLTEVLRPSWREPFERVLAPGACLRVSEALARAPRELLTRRFGLLGLTLERFRAIEPSQRRVIGAQLRRFAELLERGAVLQMAPEGLVSTDGRFGRIRLGLHALLEQTRARARVLPVGITYDSMATGRIPVYVNAGPELLDLQGAHRREVSERVTHAILAQTTLTASQLAACWLRESIGRGQRVLEDARLCEHVFDEARRFGRVGARVDPRLLARATCAARVADWLRYARRRRWLERGEAGLHRVVPDAPGRDQELRWTRNELRSLLRVWPSLEPLVHGQAA